MQVKSMQIPGTEAKQSDDMWAQRNGHTLSLIEVLTLCSVSCAVF